MCVPAQTCDGPISLSLLDSRTLPFMIVVLKQRDATKHLNRIGQEPKQFGESVGGWTYSIVTIGCILSSPFRNPVGSQLR